MKVAWKPEATLPNPPVFIDQEHVDQAIEFAKNGTPDGKTFTFSDKGQIGFRLSVQGDKASYLFKTKTATKTLGRAHPADDFQFVTLRQARELFQEVNRLMKSGLTAEAAALIKCYHSQSTKSIARAIKDSRPLPAEEPKTWTLRECFDHMIADKSATTQKKPMSDNHRRDLEVTRDRSEFAKLMSKPAVLLCKADIEAVRDSVKSNQVNAGKIGAGPSNKVVAHTRAVLNYCAKTHSGRSGLDGSNNWWNSLAQVFDNPIRKRKPHIDDIVKALILAEEYLAKPLPGRAIDVPGTNPGTLAGLWWIVLTCQRAEAGLSVLPYNIVDDTIAGWKIAAWDDGVQKNGQSFLLPIPSRAWDFIDAFRQRNKKKDATDWAFPSEVNPNIHTSVSGVYRVLYRLAARDEVKQNETKQNKKRTPRRDLFSEHGIEWWSMHDVRRTLAETLSKHGIAGGATAIFAHEIQEKELLRATNSEKRREDFHRERSARITRLAYGSEVQFIKLKKEAMETWTNAVLDRYDELTGRYEKERAEQKESDILRFIMSDSHSIKFIKQRAEWEFEKKVKDLKSQRISLIANGKTAEANALQDKLEAFVLNRGKEIDLISQTPRHRNPGCPKDVQLNIDIPQYAEFRSAFMQDEIDWAEFAQLVYENYRYDVETDRLDAPNLPDRCAP